MSLLRFCISSSCIRSYSCLASDGFSLNRCLCSLIFLTINLISSSVRGFSCPLLPSTKIGIIFSIFSMRSFSSVVVGVSISKKGNAFFSYSLL